MSDRRILVVDDDPQMVRTLCDVLRLHGWTAHAATSGEEAVGAVRTGRYALVLMDIKMGGIDGVEALKRIRELRPHARVVLMTAYSTGEVLEEAVAAGVITILSKPVALPSLLKLVREAATPERSVLVVDDDPAFLRSLCDGLDQLGVSTQPAGDLGEALDLLEQSAYDVVMLDLQLDGLSGTDSVMAVKEVRPEVLLVLFSGYPDMLWETTRAVPDSWVVASLNKPFDPRELLRVLEGIG